MEQKRSLVTKALDYLSGLFPSSSSSSVSSSSSSLLSSSSSSSSSMAVSAVPVPTSSSSAASSSAPNRGSKRLRRSPVSESSLKKVRFVGETEEHEFGVMSPPVARYLLGSLKSLSETQVKEALKHVASLTVENKRLSLELAGARIFSSDELDKLLDDEDVGLRQLFERKEFKSVDRMSRNSLVTRLSKQFVREEIEKLSEEHLKHIYRIRIGEDLQEAQLLREEAIDQELRVRQLNSMGTFAHKVQRLRRAIAADNEIMEKEEKDMQEQFHFIDSESEEAARTELEKEISRMTRESLEAISLQQGLMLPTDGDADVLMRRLMLVKEIEKQTHLLNTDLDPEALTVEQLEEEFHVRKLVIPALDHSADAPPEDRRQVMIRRLSQALLEDQTKATLRSGYEFGSRYLGEEVLGAMDVDGLIEMAQEVGLDLRNCKLQKKFLKDRIKETLFDLSRQSWKIAVVKLLKKAGINADHTSSESFESLFSRLEKLRARQALRATSSSPARRSAVVTPSQNSSSSFQTPHRRGSPGRSPRSSTPRVPTSILKKSSSDLAIAVQPTHRVVDEDSFSQEHSRTPPESPQKFVLGTSPEGSPRSRGTAVTRSQRIQAIAAANATFSRQAGGDDDLLEEPLSHRYMDVSGSPTLASREGEGSHDEEDRVEETEVHVRSGATKRKKSLG